MESLLEGKPVEPASTIYTRDYMALLGASDVTPAELLKDRVLPGLMKSVRRMPEPIQRVTSKAPETEIRIDNKVGYFLKK